MDHPISVAYLRWIVLLPLIGAVINGLARRRCIQRSFGKRAIGVIACAPVVARVRARPCAAFFQLRRPARRSSASCSIDCGRWIDVGAPARRHRLLGSIRCRR